VLAGAGDAPAAPRDPAQARLADRIGDVLRTAVPFPPDGDQPFYELGIGSIGLLQLHAQLEEALDRPIDRSALFDHPTINTLAAHLATGDRAAAAV
jgi:acyl carrier protein